MRTRRSYAVSAFALMVGLVLSLAATTPAIGQPCTPSGAGFGCQNNSCVGIGNNCKPYCVRYNPFSGTYSVLSCTCDTATACHAERPPIINSPVCVVPEDGTGTVHLPPAPCAYKTDVADPMQIIDGLPPASTIQCAATYSNFACAAGIAVCSFPTPVLPGICYAPGGSLGGEKSCSNANLNFVMTGTGAFAAYNRNLNIPISLEIHAAPRSPGDPIQNFDTDLFRVFGQITGDPDFDLLRVVGGTDFGLPSPGEAQLTMLPGGNWAAYSIFALTYRIDFVGKPGGPFSGLSGSTTGTVNIITGGIPLCAGGCFTGFECNTVKIVNPNGTIDVCCECVSLPCEPLPDGSACRPGTCGVSNCQPRCVETNPVTGLSNVTACECGDLETCEVVAPPSANPCVVPNDGTGTVHLPPAGCQYKRVGNPPMQIIDGLPAGSPVNCEPTNLNFICAGGSACSFPVPVSPGICYAPGGTLGGEKSCSNSTLNIVLQGTGVYFGYNRNINVPISHEIHAAPRTLFTSPQTFATNMFRLFGQITGDPDFDLLRFTGGSDFGLPSPGSTTLLQMPSTNWAVDSYFDLTYRIDFVGAPGGAFAGRSGSTTGTIRIATGQIVASCVGDCPPGYRCNRTMTLNTNGTISTCCDCVTDCACRGDLNGDNKVNGQDIKLFVSCVLNYTGGFIDPACVCADIDGDGVLTLGADVNQFVNKLLTLPNNQCP
ncbi:hypothetical protein RAS2_27040 [Phycisphaerae bacterium RAS2]|nr:hypothetical protein RAS2_27040 [Phycisphaerae bacterium RAS2]